MIIEKIVITEGGKTYNSLTHSEPFYAVGYDVDKNIELWTAEDDILAGGTHIGSKLDGFGSDNWTEFMAKITADGLKFPVV